MNKKKLFIGNLNYSVNEGQIRKLLSPHGDVIGVTLMEGKGYAFVEMGTEEQALNIQRTLSESVFEGRKLLIDGVPGRHKPDRREDSRSPQSPGTRPARVQTRESEPVIHHLEAVERPPKTERKKREPVTDIRKSGKPPQPGKEPAHPAKTRQEQQPSMQAPHKGKDSSHSGPDARRSPIHSGTSGRPDHPEKSDRSQKTSQPGKDPEPRSSGARIKPVKEKPPKNPHPYQGSKKSKKSLHPSGETEKSAEDSTDTEKKEYLRYWATLARKK